jgi:hypothetical protein
LLGCVTSTPASLSGPSGHLMTNIFITGFSFPILNIVMKKLHLSLRNDLKKKIPESEAQFI